MLAAISRRVLNGASSTLRDGVLTEVTAARWRGTDRGVKPLAGCAHVCMWGYTLGEEPTELAEGIYTAAWGEGVLRDPGGVETRLARGATALVPAGTTAVSGVDAPARLVRAWVATERDVDAFGRAGRYFEGA